MAVDQITIILCIALFVTASGTTWLRRKTFPLAESLMVVLIIGLGFSGAVFLATLPVKAAQITAQPSTAEMVFTFGWLAVTTAWLVLKPASRNRPGRFWQEKAATLAFKLLVFVVIPLAVLRLQFHIAWADLGFSTGDLPGQILAALILMTLFGGFNYFAGSAAAPIRKGMFKPRQAALGLAMAFGWNILETGLVEEFFFRAFLQTRLVNALGSPLAGILLTSLLFGLAHVPGIYLRRGDQTGPLGAKPAALDALLYGMVVLNAAGWFTGLLYWRTQSLLAPILVHAAVDAVAHAPEFIVQNQNAITNSGG